MPRKQTLTVAEMKSLLSANVSAQRSRQTRLNARLWQELGLEVKEEEPEVIAIKRKLDDWICDVLAGRLKRNRQTTPLLSSRDFIRFIPLMISEIEKTRGYEFDAYERKMFEKFMKSIFQNTCEVVFAMMVLPNKNPYETFQLFITTVLALAAERGVLPTEFLALENATDEITRQMLTKQEFIDLFRQTLNKFADPNVPKKMFIQPILDIVASEANEEERREMEEEVETRLMPQLRETAEKCIVVMSAWIDEEVERIYAA